MGTHISLSCILHILTTKVKCMNNLIYGITIFGYGIDIPK